MKFRGIEGTAQEIRDLFELQGLQLAAYLQPAEEALKWIWIAIPSVLYFLALICLIFVPITSKSVTTFLIALGGGSLLWLATSIQLKFKNVTATIVAAIGGFLLILVCASLMNPADVPDAIRKFRPKE